MDEQDTAMQVLEVEEQPLCYCRTAVQSSFFSSSRPSLLALHIRNSAAELRTAEGT